MGLKFRRGTNAQKSGSLAFGEPYVNTDLGTLQIGGLTGDITLGASGTGSQGTFSGISGSSLDITGYAKIDGNLTLGGTITIGDASTDNVVVNADLSSSIIPNNDNSFDLGSTSFRYRAIHGTNIYGTINATNGVISGSSQLPTLATTGSNTFRGNQTIIGSGAGFAAYISTSVNDATLGLDTTANVNALYFLKNGEKNFELSYDTTNANGIFRLLPYDNNSFFEIGNPSNSGADYVFISEPTYGNVLIGPGIGNGVSSLTGSIPLTDKVQIAGNLYVNGAIRANSFTGSIAATNGVVSGSSQVIGILSSLNAFSASNGNTSLNSYTGSNDTTNTTQNNRLSRLEESTSSLNAFSASENSKAATLALYTASVDTKFTTLQTLTASMAAQVSRLQESTASLNLYTSSNDTTNTTQNTRLTRIEESTSSLNVFSASENSKSETLRLYTASLDTKNNTLGLYTASIDTKFSTLSTYTASVDAKILRIQESTASLNSFSASINAFYNQFTASAVGFSASVDGRLDQLEYTASYGNAATIADQFGTLANVTGSLQRASASLQEFTASQNIKFETLRLYTASVDVKFTTLQSLTASNLNRFARIEESTASLNSYTSSNDTTNTTQNNRLSRIEESTASLNTFTSSIATAYESRATATKTIFSGSSQVSYVGLSNIPSGIISSSAQIDTLFNIDGIVSGSSQINFTQLSGISANIISSSSDTSNVDMIITGGSISANLFGGVVSGSSQVIGILTSLNEFSASENSKSATLATFTSSLATTYEGRASASKTIFSGSSQVNFTQLSGISNGIVSSSAQITPLLPSGVLSGSNQTNITSINQNLGTSTTGVQFASLGIGTAPDATYELKIQGDVAASGDIVAYYTSDKKLKDNIQPIQNALDKINKLGGYTFDWNEELQKARKGHDIGVIAQEVQSVLPEVVVERDNGYLGVDYQKLVPVLIEAIKELSAKVKELENK